MPQRRQTICYSSLLTLIAAATTASLGGLTPTFRGIGDLPGGIFYSQIRGISPDGRWVVGESHGTNGYVAFHMPTDATTLTALPALAGGGVAATAEDLSDNGVIAGYGYPTTPGLWVAYHGKTTGTAPQPLGYFDAEPFSRAFATSRDGQVIVGDVETTQGLQAFRWTSGGGIQPLGDLAGGDRLSQAFGVSGDGSTIVGLSLSANGVEAFRWTAAGGMHPLGDLPGGSFTSRAYAASFDGQVVVGEANGAAGTRPFKWTPAGMTDLGVPAGLNYAAAFDVSDDGRVVTGFASIAGSSGVRAFVSIDGNPARTLEDVIRNSFHLPITGWTLTESLVNSDGTVFAGIGRNPDGNVEGWIFHVPEPLALSLLLPAAATLASRRCRRR